jgi:hypothetical protein
MEEIWVPIKSDMKDLRFDGFYACLDAEFGTIYLLRFNEREKTVFHEIIKLYVSQEESRQWLYEEYSSKSMKWKKPQKKFPTRNVGEFSITPVEHSKFDLLRVILPYATRYVGYIKKDSLDLKQIKNFRKTLMLFEFIPFLTQ